MKKLLFVLLILSILFAMTIDSFADNSEKIYSTDYYELKFNKHFYEDGNDEIIILTILNGNIVAIDKFNINNYKNLRIIKFDVKKNYKLNGYAIIGKIIFISLTDDNTENQSIKFGIYFDNEILNENKIVPGCYYPFAIISNDDDDIEYEICSNKPEVEIKIINESVEGNIHKYTMIFSSEYKEDEFDIVVKSNNKILGFYNYNIIPLPRLD